MGIFIKRIKNSILRLRNLRGYKKKVTKMGILGFPLCLVPSVAYAHDFSQILTIGWGIIVFLQFCFGTIMLAWKKQELEAKRFVVSMLYVGILGIFWWLIMYAVPWFIEFLFSGDPVDKSPFLSGVIIMFMYWVILPLLAAYFVARALYQNFRKPLSISRTPSHKEGPR